MQPLPRTLSLSLLLALAACGGPSSSRDASDPTDAATPPEDASAPADGATPPEDAAQVEDVAPLPADATVPPMDSSVTPTDASAPPEDVPSPPVDSGTPPGPMNYTGNGPLTPMLGAMLPLTMPATTGCAANDCRINAFVASPAGSVPGRAAPFPVIVLSNGFRLPASQYQSYALRLARWGYVVVRWDTTTEEGFIPRSISHRVLANMLRALPDEVARAASMTGMMDTRRVVFAGHSRGGKLSALATAGNANAVGFVGLDPVDAPPPMTPPGPEYPSAATALASFRGPSVVIGAALGGVATPGSFGMACAPTMDNYRTFYTAASAPATEITLAQTGHMQFIDDRARCPASPLGGTICSLCTAGTAADTTVRDISQTVLLALSERATRGAEVSAYLTPTGSWLSIQAGVTAQVK
jgi:hypothetical protein